MIRYSDITINDRNPIKRKLQRTRLRHSLKILQSLSADAVVKILDFGAGDATLAKYVSEILPKAKIFCYEPSPDLLEQAKENPLLPPEIRITGNLSDLPARQFDYIFCLEVLEHLPENLIPHTLEQIRLLLHANGALVFSVPNEIYLAALMKGLFRLTRRWGDIDARPLNILKAILGRSITPRPVSEISKGVPYIFRHIGFDYRRLQKTIQEKFELLSGYGSPLPSLPLFFNFEIYWHCQLKKNPDK